MIANPQFGLIATTSPQITEAVATIPAETQSIEDLITEKAKKDGVDPILANKIAFCESTMRQFNKDGQVIRGVKNPDDVGLFQINESYHKKTSENLGYDISTTEGNVDYALWLIKNEGTRHWNASRGCWGNHGVS